MENESDELTEAGFRRWVITNFSVLKDHVLTQCKETKNLGKRLEEMIPRTTSLEKNINDLMELKNTAQELREAYTSFNSLINLAEERTLEIEEQFNENTRNQNTSPPTRDHNSSPAREQGWMEKEFDEMTESNIRRWIIRNFCELRERVLTQWKETKNLEKKI